MLAVRGVISPGWTVRDFRHWMFVEHPDQPGGYQGPTEARIFLAQSPGRDERLIQFWHKDCQPTEYHGRWEQRNAGAELILNFNGRGPGTDTFEGHQYPRRCHTTLLMHTNRNPDTYHGHDYKQREIRMRLTGTWELNQHHTFDWVLPPEETYLAAPHGDVDEAAAGFQHL